MGTEPRSTIELPLDALLEATRVARLGVSVALDEEGALHGGVRSTARRAGSPAAAASTRSGANAVIETRATTA